MTRFWTGLKRQAALGAERPDVSGTRKVHVPLRVGYDQALNWIRVHHASGGGIAVTDRDSASYPEVTGYIVPTLVDCGETDLAVELARWLVRIQRPDGGWTGPDGLETSYIFDTAQVMRGLLAASDLVPESLDAATRAADYMLSVTDSAGVLRPGEDSVWRRQYGWRISEDIHLYALSPLREVGRRLGEPRYLDCVDRSLEYYLSKPDLARFRYLTHFYGYVLEALVDLEFTDRACEGLDGLIAQQWHNGGVPAEPGAMWVCSPGTAQLAIVGYKLGKTEFADEALRFLQSFQQSSGGFKGSYGPNAAYGPDSEPSWACKYFLDACHWKLRATGEWGWGSRPLVGLKRAMDRS